MHFNVCKISIPRTGPFTYATQVMVGNLLFTYSVVVDSTPPIASGSMIWLNTTHFRAAFNFSELITPLSTVSFSVIKLLHFHGVQVNAYSGV